MTANTIFARATAPGKAGIAIVRISGPEAGKAVETLTGKPLSLPRLATLRTFIRADGTIIDEGLVLYFPAPHSFTGEDVAELHVHGSNAVLKQIARCLAAIPGLRHAGPGEFSRRAFLNGKMDLVEAEGLADLIAAETEAQHRQATRQMQGEVSTLYESWRQQIIQILAYIEAYIDFPDEDIPAAIKLDIQSRTFALLSEIRLHLDNSHRGQAIREGIYVAILGAPNAGKSSLLNALAKRDVAIVSHIAGTTRDVLEVYMDIGGYPVMFCDTAGLRESSDTIEQEGIARARRTAETADLKIVMFDASQVIDSTISALVDERTILVANKMDLASVIKQTEALPLSLKTGEGLDQLLKTLTLRLEETFASTALAPARERHREHLKECADHLTRAADMDLSVCDITLPAEDLRLAAQALARITGRIDVEDILDVVFRSFCIGK